MGAGLISMVLMVQAMNLVLSQSTCGPIGNNNTETQLTQAAGNRRFYLNTANSATCSGTVSSWTVCYYGPDSLDSDASYWATYAVYRRNDSGGQERYERVSRIFSAVRANGIAARFVDPEDGGIQQGGFVCYNDSTGDPTVMIQAGDIVGACIFDPDEPLLLDFNRFQLDIVGRQGRLGESLLELDESDADCSRNSIPNDILRNDLSVRNDRKLHLYANIIPVSVEVTTAGTTFTATNEVETGDGATDSPSNFNDGGSQNDHTGVIVGIIIGLLIILALGVAIVVVVLYLVRRGKTGGKYSTGNGDIGLDNLTYGTGEDVSNKLNGKIPILEASTYEVPVSGSADAVTQAVKTGPEYELTESTYAVPNVYEYATLGPNEQMDVSSGQYYSPLDEATISYAKLLEKNREADIYDNVEKYLQPAAGESELYAQIKACGIKNIPSSHIQINGHLGSGQFGSVERGLWKDGTRNVLVAVKLLKEGATEMDKVKFLQEAAIMAQFTHPNVVSLYGVISKTEPLKLVVELIERGNLRELLHTMRPDPGELPAANISQLLLSFCQQVALGMHYLSAKRFVHRDLAARNILVSKDNICKVADFGMSRDLANDTYYVSQGGQVPVKWTAPEAIHYKKYSVASDIWSYGCLLYEIWSLGYKPFEGTTNAKVVQLVDSGQRLPPPPGCSRVIYELMIKCWNPVVSSRPGFREIFLSLLDTPEDVLSIPPKALDSHHLAGIIGSPLEAGENMYIDLQDNYLETDCDYEIN